MARLSKFLIAAAATLVVPASSALAQDAPEEGTEAPVEGTEGTGEEAMPPPDDSGMTEATPPPAVGAGQMIGPFTKETYPQELIFRPLTLPAGMIEVRPSLSFFKIVLVDDTFILLNAGVAYGVTDKIEVGLNTGLLLSPDVDWSESIGLYGAFSAIDGDKLDLAPSLSTSLDFADGADVFSGVSIGAGLRYLLSDKLFVRAGQNLLDIIVAPDAGARLNINAGIGFQATPQLAVVADLNMISLKLFGDAVGDSTFFDPFGVTLTGLFAVSNKLDAYAQISLPSIADAGDIYLVTLGANFRL